MIKVAAITALITGLVAAGSTAAFADTSLASPAPVSPVYAVTVHVSRSTYKFTHPHQMEPEGVVDQRQIRQTNYTDPMHCDLTGLLTPLQMEAAEKACSERFFNVDHSG